jgi:crotonobetainyl-CoA:carnitine CoA-transferase CaiB-like acyl-CoA transferase
MFKPLTGVRVVDLTQVLAGPYAAYQLALLGAEVLKIEMPGEGDWSRDKGQVPELNGTRMGLTYLTQNADKKSVAVDLKSPEGLEVMKRLLKDADIFLENFRPGAVARLGLGFDVVREINPSIVYCSISAFGQDGEFSSRPAYDHVIQGMCGIMKTTGTVETGPQKVGAPYVDYSTGLNAAFAILAGLLEVKRTGKAVQLDVAMLDTSMMLMISLITSHLTGGWKPAPSGNEAWSQSPASGAFETSDGLLMLAANNDRQFTAMCAAIGRKDILESPMWNDPKERARNARDLRAELVALFRTRPALEWEAIMHEAGVPAAKVRSLDETLAEEHSKTREFVRPMKWSRSPETIHLPTLGFKANGEVISATTPPPELGADTYAVLKALGYEEAELARLSGLGVI